MKYWLRYSKTGLSRFVGHLDMLHHWERILRRAWLPLSFSQGFSPHPLLSLAAPLPVGQASTAEYLEMELVAELTPEELLTAVQPVLPADIQLLGAVMVPDQTKPLMSMIRFADYRLVSAEADGLHDEVQQLLESPAVLLSVKRKSGVKEVDIRPLIRSLQVDSAGQLLACLATGSSGNLRPEDLWRALTAASLNSILRQELYLTVGDRLVTPWQYVGSES